MNEDIQKEYRENKWEVEAARLLVREANELFDIKVSEDFSNSNDGLVALELSLTPVTLDPKFAANMRDLSGKLLDFCLDRCLRHHPDADDPNDDKISKPEGVPFPRLRTKEAVEFLASADSSKPIPVDDHLMLLESRLAELVTFVDGMYSMMIGATRAMGALEEEQEELSKTFGVEPYDGWREEEDERIVAFQKEDHVDKKGGIDDLGNIET